MTTHLAESRIAADFVAWKPLQPAAVEPSLVSDRLTVWASRLDAAWRFPLLRLRLAPAVLFAVLLTVCALRAWIGLAGVQVFSHDAFMPLDGAWRMMNGQRPHLDFYSFIGVLAYAPTLAGLWLARGGAEGFAYAQALVGLALGIWAYLLTRKRLTDVPAALFCLAVVLLCTAPFPLGYPPLGISPATVYNRYGYAVLSLIVLEAAVPRRYRPAEFQGGFSTATLLVLLLFLKVTFFGAAVFLIASLAFCRPQSPRRIAGLCSGLIAALLPFCAYFGFHMLPMVRDLAMVAGAKRIHFSWYLFDSISSDAAVLLGFAAIVAALLVQQRRQHSARTLAITAAAVSFASVLLILGNCEPQGLPLSVFFVLIAVSRFDFPRKGSGQLVRSAALLWAALFTAAALAPSALGFGYAALLRIISAPHETPMAGTALSKFIPTGRDTDYRAFVNDGIALLQQHRIKSDTVMSLDFTNPFSFGLGMKPAQGGTTALHYQTTFNDNHRPTAEQLVGSAQLVMMPKNFSEPTLQDSIPRLYGPYLASHFRIAGESRQWTLYRSLK